MTNEIDIENLINMNHRILILLGIATSIIMDIKDYPSLKGNNKYDWFLEAVDEVIYNNNPLPEFPK